MCRRSSAGCWLACWLVSKKEATTERRAHDPNNPKSPNASPERHAPRRCLVSRRAADGRARGVRSTRSESAQQRHAAPAHAPACRTTTTDDRQTTRGDRRGETNVARRSRQPSRPGVAASHATGRGAAWRVGAAGAACACGRRARPREIAELRSGGQERALSVCGGNSHPSSTAPCCSCAPCSPRRPVVRRAPAGAQVPSNCCGRVVEFWMCQHRNIQKRRRRADQLISAQTALCSGVGCRDESDEGAAVGSGVGAPLGSAVGVGDGSDVGSARRQRARQQRARRDSARCCCCCVCRFLRRGRQGRRRG